jgi:hypothetical protein
MWDRDAGKSRRWLSSSHLGDVHTRREAPNASFDSLIVMPRHQFRVWRVLITRKTVGWKRLAVQIGMLLRLWEEIMDVEGVTLESSAGKRLLSRS